MRPPAFLFGCSFIGSAGIRRAAGLLVPGLRGPGSLIRDFPHIQTGLRGRSCRTSRPSDLKWASCPFDPYPACLFGAAKGTNRPPAHRLP